MSQNIRSRFSIVLIIPAVILIIALLIFPLGLIPLRTQHAASEKGMAVSGPVQEDIPLAGIFRPAHNRLTSVGFRFYVPGSSDNPGYIHFILKNQHDTILYETTVNIHEIDNNKYYHFSIPFSLDRDEVYVYQLNAYQYADTAPCIYLGSPDVATAEHQAVYYNGTELPGNAPIAVYTYRAGADLETALPYLIVLSCAGILFTASVPPAAKSENTPEESET